MSNNDWKRLLAEPGLDGHIVQLYQDSDFYGEAISHFAAEGLVRGESVILVATEPNWQSISARLRNKGFDVPDLFDRGQLTFLNANDTLPLFMRGSMPDGNIFKPLAHETIQRARRGGTYSGVRWWGEMVNVLYVEGNGEGSNRLEQFFDDVAHEATIPIFCSFFMDRYSPAIYEQAFANVCATHGHVIPAQDYVSHRQAVNKAITEVVGPIEGELLRSMASWKRNAAGMPSSQQALLWVKEAVPAHFQDVLERAKAYDMPAVEGGKP
ncbi:MAG TPA: MEDS domain-containing protein [Candidatus Baltobacteraceae bacterium]